MKSKFYSLVLCLIFSIGYLRAQEYYVSFAGTGATSTLTTVLVENLTQGTSLTMSGTDVLHLMGIITGIEPLKSDETGKIDFYPNPMKDHARMQFDLPEAGETMITLHDLSGRKILQSQNMLAKGKHSYMIQGIKEGLYIVNISSGRFAFSGRLVSSGSRDNNAKVVYENTIAAKENQGDSKGVNSEITMQYNPGDRLKFTGTTGDYSTVTTIIPSANQTITFNLTACTDGDGNNYPVVTIGLQVWMAGNLKTSKYNNGNLIGTTTPATLDISTENSPKYQWPYDGNEGNVSTYGRLYTWHAVTDTRNLCPVGWHVPSDAEFTTLTDYLTNNGFGFQGNGTWIAKSMAATSGWTTNGTAGTIGNDQMNNNASGFTTLPAGNRASDNFFYNLGDYGYYWTSSGKSSTEAWYRLMRYSSATVGKYSVLKPNGFSVRCLKD